jgi:hypothetical protein
LSKLPQIGVLQWIERVIHILGERWVRTYHLKTTLLVTSGYFLYLLCRLVVGGMPSLRDKIELVNLSVVWWQLSRLSSAWPRPITASRTTPRGAAGIRCCVRYLGSPPSSPCTSASSGRLRRWPDQEG